VKYRRRYKRPTDRDTVAFYDRLYQRGGVGDISIPLSWLGKGMYAPDFKERTGPGEPPQAFIDQYGLRQGRRVWACPGCTLVFEGGGTLAASPGGMKACGTCRRRS